MTDNAPVAQNDVAKTISDRGVFLLYKGEYHTAGKEHPRFEDIKAALQAERYDEAVTLMNPAQGLNTWGTKAESESFNIDEDGIISVDGNRFNVTVSGKAISMMNAGLSPKALENFLRKVLENPSASARNELLLFCEASNFPIHEDGDIVAFKGVRSDYYDCHSGTIENKVGAVVKMDRNKVDDRRDVTCSFGLHFGTYEQASGYGAKIMVLKVNPKNVVSIPSDYNNSKGRCCEYVVVSETPNRARLEQREVYTNRDIGVADDDRYGDDACECCGRECDSIELDSDGLCDNCCENI